MQNLIVGKAITGFSAFVMDFVSDRLTDGQWFQILTVVDQFTRECIICWPIGVDRGESVASTGPSCSRSAHLYLRADAKTNDQLKSEVDH
jgi:hypothetical protein